MKLKIRKKLDPVLRQPNEDAAVFDFKLQKLIDDMVETMREKNGIGLAAPQVGVSKKLLICEFEGDKESNIPSFPLTVLCNPKIESTSKTEKNMVEGCLSFPGLELLVKRPTEIKVSGKDRYGKDIEIEASGLYARVLQHEIDHLNSTLFIDHLQKIDIIFIGTGTLGLKSLELLAKDQQYNIKAVITSEFTASGRKKELAKNPILELAKKINLPTIKTKNINDEKIIAKIRDLKPDLGIMADFGQIISREILDFPKHGIINIHPSILPKHRGSSPIQQTILDGDKHAGVTLMLTIPKMDAGGIISQISVELTGSETNSILKEYLGELASSLLLNSIPYYLAGDLKPLPQDESKASYTKIFKKEDGFVDLNTPAVTVERKIRAYDIWPKVYTIVKNKRIQLLASHISENGELVIDRVKPEGKKEMTYEEYLRGYKTRLTFGA